MKKIYYLATCDTCKKMLTRLNPGEEVVLQEIKSEPIQEIQLEEMYRLAGSYQALFSKRSRRYRALGLHEQRLTEADYKRYILEEYTFLKRPVMILGEQIFIGNAKKVVDAADAALNG